MPSHPEMFFLIIFYFKELFIFSLIHVEEDTWYPKQLTTCRCHTAVHCFVHQHLTFGALYWVLSKACYILTNHTKSVLIANTFLTASLPGFTKLYGWWKIIIYTTSTNTLWIIKDVYVYHSIYVFRFAIRSSATLNNKNKQLTCIFTKIHSDLKQQKICLQEETQTSEVVLNKVLPSGQKHPSPKELQFLFCGPSPLHCWENSSLYLNKKSVKRYHYFRNRTIIYHYKSA